MALKSKPIFRKVVYPFYDTEISCIIIIIMMLIVLLFGIAGIAVVVENDKYSSYLWVPGLVVCLSFVVFVSELIRFIRHYIDNLLK